jgi:hypothetical protein
MIKTDHPLGVSKRLLRKTRESHRKTHAPEGDGARRDGR